MATPTIQSTVITSGPGMLRAAPLGSTIPTWAVSGSSFAGLSWDAAWFQVGSTDEGITETHEITTEDMEVAESLYPVRTVTTSKRTTIAAALAHLSTKNFLLAMNAATAAAAVTGTGATTMTTITPPLAGAEVRYMLAWQSVDDTEIIIAYQVFNTGSVAIPRRKGADKAVLPMEWSAELPDPLVATVPYRRYLAGTKYAV